MFRPGLILALAASAVFAQTTTVNVPVPASSVAVPVAVAPGQVTVAGTVILVPPVTGGGTTPPDGGGTTPPPTGCGRPAGNTGTGLYVACGRMNNPDGTEFRMIGPNRAHPDQGGQAGLSLAGANVARSSYYPYLGNPTVAGVNDTRALQAKQIVSVFGSWDATCKTDTGSLQTAINRWLVDKAAWLQFNGTAILNIANEWGPSNSTAWRDAYVAALPRLRAAGYTLPIMIDSGGCGQDTGDLLNYAAAVAAADPQKNVIFGYHQYGNLNQTNMHNFYAQLAGLSKANPALAFVIGEFGPCCGLNGQTVQPDDVVATAQGNGLGWIPWAWDDNNLPDCKSNDAWFSMTTNCAQYSGSPNDLTKFGKDMVGQFQAIKAAKAKVF